LEGPINDYWTTKLENVKDNLNSNNFNAFVAEDEGHASNIILDEILPKLKPTSVSWGGSLTFKDSGLYEVLKNRDDYEVIDTFDHSISKEDALERRRQALLSDLYITGTNAVTENGSLVNLDMIGNRVAAITFGPKNVIILVGRNKIVQDLESAVKRIKQYSAPVNTRRLNKKTPCLKTSYCSDCNSPDRICNTWTITEKSFPKKRVNVILINKDLGF
jgi:L-lactate utilization protein LutB